MSDHGERISYLPSAGLSYDPAEEKYWDKKALNQELVRAYEICHGCRMCFKYCDTFPKLFNLLDQKYDGDVRKVTEDETRDLMNACFQCKLCEVQCPYTPRDKHEFQLDFPKLVHRYNAIRHKEDGTTLRELFLGNPDMAGALSRVSLGTANAMNKVRLHRWFMEKVLGIHRDKLLPDFANETFEDWAESEGLVKEDSPSCEVVLFQTCYVQNNEPEIGKDTVEVFKKNQVDIRCEKGLQCCGMPKWESGDLDGLRKQAAANIDKLEPFVDAGAKIVAINPTCSMMFRREYPELVAPELRERAEKVAAATVDPSEYLWSIRNEERFNTDFKSTPGTSVGYHAPCHLRAQSVGFKGRDLLRKIPGVVPKTVSECCGHDGTYAMKVESFEVSGRIGQKAFDGMKAAESEVWSTDCPLAAIQFKQFGGVKPLHPMTIMARAYRADGFPTRLAEKEKIDEKS